MARVRPNAKQRERLQRSIEQIRSMFKRLDPADRKRLKPQLDKIEDELNNPVGLDFNLIMQLITALLPILLKLLGL